MGKKLQGAKLRAKKRGRALLDELQETQAEAAAAHTVTHAPDGDIFMVDTTGESVPHHKRPSKLDTATKRVKICLSKAEQQKVGAILETHGVEGAKALAEKSRRRSARRAPKSNFDLWDEEPATAKSKRNSGGETAKSKGSAKATAIDNIDPTDAVHQFQESAKGIGSTLAGVAPAHVKTQATTRSRRGSSNANAKTKSAKPTVAVDVAQQGQSYIPDPVSHQRLLHKAAVVEVARNRAVAKMHAPISTGLKPETRALLVVDSSSSDDDSDAEDTTPDTPVGEIPKRSNKLTIAQRNKQKRHRDLMAAQLERKKQKQFLNQVAELPRLKKQLHKQEKEKRQATSAATAKPIVPLGSNVDFKPHTVDPVHAPTVPVALTPSDSSRCSLRTLQPKGSLAQDRTSSMADRHLTVTKSHSREAQQRRQRSHKRRKRSMKGRHNRDARAGANHEILG